MKSLRSRHWADIEKELRIHMQGIEKKQDRDMLVGQEGFQFGRVVEHFRNSYSSFRDWFGPKHF